MLARFAGAEIELILDATDLADRPPMLFVAVRYKLECLSGKRMERFIRLHGRHKRKIGAFAEIIRVGLAFAEQEPRPLGFTRLMGKLSPILWMPLCYMTPIIAQAHKEL